MLHQGYFEQTLPAELPTQVAFAHLDCGFGGDAQAHQAVLLHCLAAPAPEPRRRVRCSWTTSAPCLPASYGGVNGGGQLATDEFMADKPEQVEELYGNQYAHAFFRKLP